MRILWMYRYIKEYDFDNWLHMKFAEYMAKYPGIELFAFGPDLDILYSNITPIKHHPHMTMVDICSMLKPDVVVLNTKSRMFHYYNPHKNEAKDCWLPPDFKTYDKIPKIVIEEDYHYEKNDDWYAEMGIDLILQRHFNSVKRQDKVQMDWLPFSVDTTVFNEQITKPRINKVCFAGSMNLAYPERQRISEALNGKRLLDMFHGKQMVGQNYVNCLKSYTLGLSGTSKYFITPAKMFEIMASGTIMLTNNDPHLNLLFDSGSYITYDLNEPDCEAKTIHKIEQVLNIQEHRERILAKARHDIHTRHSHDIRIKHFINIVNCLKSGRVYKEIKRNLHETNAY